MTEIVTELGFATKNAFPDSHSSFYLSSIYDNIYFRIL